MVGTTLGVTGLVAASGEIRMGMSWPEPKSKTFIRLKFDGLPGEAVYGPRNLAWVAAEHVSGPEGPVAACGEVGNATGEFDPFENDGYQNVDWESVGTKTGKYTFQVDPGWYRVVATFSPDPETVHPRELWRCTSSPFHVDKPESYSIVY